MPDEEEARSPLSEPPPENEPETEQELVCDTCFNDNLLKNVGVLKCLKCAKIFCIHFASTIDPQYCVSCMSDVSLTKEKISKTYEHYNPVTDQITKYSRRARRYILEGNDWLFAQRRIAALSDAELELAQEYHRGLQNLILLEAEQRKTEKMHRYAGVKLAPTGISSVVTTTTVKKSTKTSSTKAQAQVAALFSAMLAKGLTMEQIQAAMKGTKA